MLKIILVFFTVVYFIVYFFFAAKTGKPIKTMLLYGVCGLAALTVINLTSKYTGTYIPINYYTVGVGGGLGLPGVIGLVFLKMIF